jgi:hypothetical protein
MAGWPYNTTAWKKLRALKLRHDPMCHACALRGRSVPARAVDHVVSIKSGGEPFPALDWLMSLCIACHSIKTAGVDRFDRAGSGRRFKGHDVNGNPIDAQDEWHGGRSHRQEDGGPRPLGELGKYLVSGCHNKDDGATVNPDDRFYIGGERE